MKKMYSQYSGLNDLMENINDIISDLEEMIDGIDWDKDTTDSRERRKYYEIDDQLSNLEKCAYYIGQAMECLKEYRD